MISMYLPKTSPLLFFFLFKKKSFPSFIIPPFVKYLTRAFYSFFIFSKAKIY